jgi:hypothetical protein
MNKGKSLLWVLWLLCLGLLQSSCSREVLSGSSSETDPDPAPSAGSLRIVIRTPSPDGVYNPSSRAAMAGGGNQPSAVLHEVQEWTVKKLGVYIFMASTANAADNAYRLVKKTEGITFGAAGVPDQTGTDLGNGEYTYTESLEDFMIGHRLKVLLVANESTELGTANEDGASGTTLQDFKVLTAGAVLEDSEGQSADKISGGAYTGEGDLTGGTYTGLVMSGTAVKGSSEEINLASPASLELEATLTRIVARIDICLNKKNLTLKKAVLKNAARKAYIFPQTSTAAAEGLMLSYPLLPVSKYTEQLGDGKPGIAY